MRIEAASLVADGLRYTGSPHDGVTNEVVLGASGGVTGYYEHEHAHLVDARAVRFAVTSALWHLVGARIGVHEPSRLDGVRLLLSIPPGDAPTTLHLEVKSAALGRLEYVGHGLSLSLVATLEGLVIDRTGSGVTTITCGLVVACELRLVMKGVDLSVAEARIETATLVSGSSPTDARAQRVELVGVSLASPSAPVAIARLEAHDLSFHDGHVEAREIAVSDTSVVYAFSPPNPMHESAELSTNSAAPLDLPALDGLEGNVSIDVQITAAVPLLSNREVHHPLRVPIDRGALSFGKLEDDLSLLADAILDFEVEGDELILELDVIPIVKFDNVTLVSWSLTDPVDHELARDKRIRLRRLLQYRLPGASTPRKPRADGKEKQKSFRLVGIDLAAIAISLSLPLPTELALGGGLLRLGGGGRPSVGSFTVTGDIAALNEGEPRAGYVDIEASGVHGEISNLSLGPTRIDRGRIDIGAIEQVHVDFVGVSPRKIAGVVRTVRLEGLALDLVAPK